MGANLNFVLLHGFLGAPADFSSLKEEILARSPQARFWSPDLFESKSALNSNQSFEDWTKAFLEEVRAQFDSQPVCLIGYSMGGRLALHAHLESPVQFSSTILLSTNPGWLPGHPSERQAWEESWREKMLTFPERELYQEWNRQEVFSSSQVREPTPLNRETRDLLAKALIEWSLLKHRFDWADLKRLKASTRWYFGGEDKKFLSVKEALAMHNVPGGRQIIEGAGHRLIFDAPAVIASAACERVGEE